MTSLATYINPCSANSGGAVALYLAVAADITSFTLGTGVSSYDTCTLVTGKVWAQFDFEEETAAFKPTLEASKGAQKWTHIIEVDLGKLSLTVRDAIMSLTDNSPCGLIALFKDANDQVWVVGYDEKDAKARPLRVESMNGDSKTDLLEPSETILTLSTAPAGNREMARTYTGTITLV